MIKIKTAQNFHLPNSSRLVSSSGVYTNNPAYLNRLCGSFNDRLGHILDDAGYFIKLTRNNEVADVNKSGFQPPQTKVSILAE